MTILRALAPRHEERGRVIGDGNDPALLGASPSGRFGFSDEAALAVTAFYAGVSLIAETCAMVPMEIRHESPSGEITRDRTSRLATIFGEEINPEQNTGEVIEFCAASIKMRGSAYLWRLRTPDGRFNGYVPVAPQRVQPFRNRDGELRYLVSEDRDSQGDIAGTTRDILHIRGTNQGGLRPWSPIEVQRDLLRRSRSEAEYQQSVLDQGVRPSGVLTAPEELSDEAIERLSKRWNAANAGYRKGGKTVLLEGGVTWQQVSLSAADAQFLEQRQFSRQEMAMMLRLPAGVLLADTGGTLHYTSASMDLQWLAQYSIAPVLSRICRAIAWDPEVPWRSAVAKPGRTFPAFNLDALSDADPTTRAQNHVLFRQSGITTANERRLLEGLPPIEGGDVLPPVKPGGEVSVTEPKG
ncbi:phage portal protein [Patulibacter defluvii]|uniref:phage portal protein n=1 Tax=Patulibacter defluvii TaxID=3095358 RepID=UPI002A7477E2|nr:phage portal protein [Patulibacter sp. DM4]